MAVMKANSETEMILSKDVEFDTYAEQVAFLKGLKYEGVENIEVLAISFHDTPQTGSTLSLSAFKPLTLRMLLGYMLLGLSL
jgi:hypothetical protein